MAHRLSKITTRTGDAGKTGLGDGSRVSKDNPRVRALGEVDELNSTLGLLAAEPLPPEVASALSEIQHDLFDLGGELSIPGHAMLTDTQVARLDAAIDGWNGELAPLKDFILPGGSRAAALAHVARTVCRRAERAVVALGSSEAVAPPLVQYLNRLSDLLFVLARALNRHAGRNDIYWQQGKNRG